MELNDASGLWTTLWIKTAEDEEQRGSETVGGEGASSTQPRPGRRGALFHAKQLEEECIIVWVE